MHKHPLVALGLAGVLTLGACTGGGSQTTALPSDPLAAIREAVRRTEAASRFRVHSSLQAGSQTATGEGIVDLAGHIEQMTIDSPSEENSNGKVTVAYQQQTTIVVGGARYIQDLGPASPAILCPGQPSTAAPSSPTTSVRFRVIRFNEVPGDAAAIQQFVGATGVRFFLAALRAAQAARLIGSDPIDGRSTRHYHATVTGEELLAAVPSAVARILRSSATSAPSEPAQIDVWISADGLIRQLSGIPTSGSNSGVFRFTDFGLRVTVVPPPASELERGGGPLASCYRPNGDWAVVGAGSADGVAWQLLRTNATNGGDLP